MRTLIRSLATTIALLTASQAVAQNFPLTMPAGTVYGRLGIGSGPGSAIPFASITGQLFSASPNTIFAGPSSGSTSGSAAFRAIVGADLPAINLAASGAGGVTGQLPIANTCPGATGATSSTFLRGDCTWGAPNSTILSANNSYTGDQYFGSGRPWCDVRAKGAVGDGVTDDTAAFNACITELVSLYGSGIIFIPPSATAYCTFTGIVVSTGSFTNGDIRFIGGGVRSSLVSSCGHNTTVFTIGNQFATIEDISVFGYGFGTDTFAAGSNPAVFLTSTASYSVLRHMYIAGGTFPIESQCSGCRIIEVTAQFGYGDSSGLRAANAYVLNSGQYWLHDSFDQILPVTPTPTFPTTVASWASAHSYTKGTIVLVTCAGRNWYIQASVAGTSGSSSPTCRNYGQNITDNTVTWLLATPSPFYLMQVDSGSNEVIIDSTDLTGFSSACFAMTNTFAGTAPINVRLHSTTPGACLSQGVLISAGSNFRIEGGDIQGCVGAGCEGIFVGGVTSNIMVSGVQFDNGGAFSVVVGATTTNVTLTGNQFGMGSTNAVSITSGADYVAAAGNSCFGASAGMTGTIGSHSYFPTGTSGNPGC